MIFEKDHLLTYYEEALIEKIGSDAALQAIEVMLLVMGGVRMRFPTIEDLHRLRRNKYIQVRFNGENGNELAEIFGISKRQVLRIANGQFGRGGCVQQDENPLVLSTDNS
jgi:Mor family transcriptional regulator